MPNNKQKGNSGERELAEFFRENGVDARRTSQYSAASPDDADLITDLTGVFVECKRCQQQDIHNWITKAVIQSKGEKLPVVFWRKNDSFWVGIVLGSTMIELLKQYNRDKNGQTRKENSE